MMSSQPAAKRMRPNGAGGPPPGMNMPNPGNMGMGNMNPGGGPPMMPGPPMGVPPNSSSIVTVLNIPMNCTEKDLFNIFAKYGNIRGVHVNNGMGLVDFMDINIAAQMVTNAQTMPFYVGQNVAKLEFAQPTIAMFVQAMQPQNVQPNYSNAPPPTPTIINTEDLSSVLQFDIANAQYPITVDVLKTICSSSGTVLRIIIGKKKADNSVEALIEFGSQSEAKSAKEALHGADIYSGCCTLTISYSKLQRLQVLKNDTDSWDYTSSNPGATPVKEGLLGSQPNVAGQPSLFQQQQQMQQQQPGLQPSGSPGNMGYPNSMPGVPNMGMMQPPNMMGPMGPGNEYVSKYPPPGHGPMPYYMKPGGQPPMGPGPMGGPMHGPMPGPMPGPIGGPGSGPMPGPMPGHMPGPMPGPIPGPLPVASGPNSQPPNASGGSGSSNQQGAVVTAGSGNSGTFVPFQVGEGVVIMTYNMSPHTNCDHLFNLFCLYGNVARIKFLKSRQGCAMIQMGSKDAAELVLRYFDGVRLFNSVIQVCRSKQMEVQDQANAMELADGSLLQVNYMQNPNNRYRNAEVASKCKIVQPGKTLHFFNIPPTFSRDQLVDLFVRHGAKTPDKCVIFPVKPQQKAAIGLVEWETVEDAVDALARTNHTAIELDTYNHPFHLKLAFSNKPVTEGSSRPMRMDGDPRSGATPNKTESSGDARNHEDKE